MREEKGEKPYRYFYKEEEGHDEMYEVRLNRR